MAQDSWPSPAHNDRVVTDTEYERIAARFSDDGLWGNPTDPAALTTSTGLQVTLRADLWASVRGHAWTSGTTAVTLPVPANTSGSTRTDRVVLRLDRSTWTVRAVIKQGTPGAGAPALTQDQSGTGVYEILLAGVTVPAGASSVQVIRGELYVGTRIRPVTSGHPNPTPALGEIHYETDSGRLRFYDGSQRRTLYDDSGTVTVDGTAAPWTVGTASVLEMRSGNVHFRVGSFTRTAGGSLASGEESRLPVLIPAAYRHRNRDQYVILYCTGPRIARATLYSANHTRAGQLWLTQHPGITTGQNILGQGMSWVVD
ncbi:hypothetical protein [Streptomyces corynorhini]|uniref:Minor tail protein n=1 Tax=Streptomyces corynorhini TaxID=2282652 RepID=A0A370B842_9ACTN|nr:hypothetical protein [Streptomyces corynorhini]RDG37970.1 hypothetical protein DVH02_11645 [Streptomyces corynorhini]